MRRISEAKDELPLARNKLYSGAVVNQPPSFLLSPIKTRESRYFMRQWYLDSRTGDSNTASRPTGGLCSPWINRHATRLFGTSLAHHCCVDCCILSGKRAFAYQINWWSMRPCMTKPPKRLRRRSRVSNAKRGVHVADAMCDEPCRCGSTDHHRRFELRRRMYAPS